MVYHSIKGQFPGFTDKTTSILSSVIKLLILQVRKVCKEGCASNFVYFTYIRHMKYS